MYAHIHIYIDMHFLESPLVCFSCHSVTIAIVIPTGGNTTCDSSFGPLQYVACQCLGPLAPTGLPLVLPTGGNAAAVASSSDAPPITTRDKDSHAGGNGSSVASAARGPGPGQEAMMGLLAPRPPQPSGFMSGGAGAVDNNNSNSGNVTGGDSSSASGQGVGPEGKGSDVASGQGLGPAQGSDAMDTS